MAQNNENQVKISSAVLKITDRIRTAKSELEALKANNAPEDEVAKAEKELKKLYKQLDKISSKVRLKILSAKGKIDLFTEYADYYAVLLAQKTANRRSSLEARLDSVVMAEKFYLESDESIMSSLERSVLAGKQHQLDLQYRKMREANKRAIAKDPSLEESLNAALAQKKMDNDAALEAFREEEMRLIQSEKSTKATIDHEAKMAQASADKEARLAAFDEKTAVADSKKIQNNTAKMHSRIEKLQDQLLELRAELAEINSVQNLSSSLDNDQILLVKELCMYFGGLHAVEHLSFDVRRGEIFGLIGPNGAGKTTVFNCITQFYHPTGGDLTFRTREGNVINLNNEQIHNIITLGIARTFQNIEVVRECTVLENLLIAANRQYQSSLFDHCVHSGLLKLEEQVIAQRAMKVLDFMGLTQYAGALAFGLPYGVLKKIEIARTLMTNPQLIILDEPAAGLNDSETKELAALIRRIREEYQCTILLVEHDMGLVMDICDRICAISFGKLLAIGTPAEIQANKAVQEAYLGVDDEQ